MVRLVRYCRFQSQRTGAQAGVLEAAACLPMDRPEFEGLADFRSSLRMEECLLGLPAQCSRFLDQHRGAQAGFEQA